MSHVPTYMQPEPSVSLKPAFPVEPAQTPEGTKFPEAIFVKDLTKTNCGYDGQKYQKYRAIYRAGESFDQLKNEFLVKRALEQSTTDANLGGQKQYDERSKRAYYIPRGSGLIDWMASEATKDPVTVTVNGKKSDSKGEEKEGVVVEKQEKPNEKEQYYFDLIKDADGLGRDATSIATSLCRESMLFGRAYLMAYFSSETGHVSDPDSLAAKMRVLPTDSIDDWLYDSSGQLSWVRVHSVEEVRSSEWWKQPEVERHCWTYVTATEHVTYSATKKKGEAGWKDNEQAVKTDESKHSFGRIPIFSVEIEDGINVMDRIYDVLKALYNREASVTWALDQQAYAMLVFNLNETQVAQVYSSEAVAVVLKPQETAEFKAPNPQIFDPLFKDCERLKQALYEVLQATAITASSQTQNARQSASAKTLDMDLIQSLLRAYVVPVRNAMRLWIREVQRYRGDEAMDVEMGGLTAINTTLAQLDEMINGKKGQSPQQKANRISEEEEENNGQK